MSHVVKIYKKKQTKKWLVSYCHLDEEHLFIALNILSLTHPLTYSLTYKLKLNIHLKLKP